jgi:hypothetical protein
MTRIRREKSNSCDSLYSWSKKENGSTGISTPTGFFNPNIFGIANCRMILKSDGISQRFEEGIEDLGETCLDVHSSFLLCFCKTNGISLQILGLPAIKFSTKALFLALSPSSRRGMDRIAIGWLASLQQCDHHQMRDVHQPTSSLANLSECGLPKGSTSIW